MRRGGVSERMWLQVHTRADSLFFFLYVLNMLVVMQLSEPPSKGGSCSSPQSYRVGCVCVCFVHLCVWVKIPHAPPALVFNTYYVCFLFFFFLWSNTYLWHAGMSLCCGVTLLPSLMIHQSQDEWLLIRIVQTDDQAMSCCVTCQRAWKKKRRENTG